MNEDEKKLKRMLGDMAFNLEENKDQYKDLQKTIDKQIKQIRDFKFNKERREQELKSLKSSLKIVEDKLDKSEELYDTLWDQSGEIEGGRVDAEEDLEALLLSLNNDRILEWKKNYYLEDDKKMMKKVFDRHEGRNQYSNPYAEGKTIDELTDRLYTELFDFEKIRKARKTKPMTNDELLRLRRRVRGDVDSDDDSMDKEYDIEDKESEIERLKRDADMEEGDPFYSASDVLEAKNKIKKLKEEIKKLKEPPQERLVYKQPSKSALFTKIRQEMADEEEKINKSLTKKFYSPIKDKNISKKIKERLVKEFPDIRDKGIKYRDSYLKSFNDLYGEGLAEEIITYVLGENALNPF